jgi:hypothetical protein
VRSRTATGTLYGDDIVGGTSWIYLADRSPEELGFPQGLPKEPLPSLTWRAISKLPFVVIGVGLVLSAVVRWRTRNPRSSHDDFNWILALFRLFGVLVMMSGAVVAFAGCSPAVKRSRNISRAYLAGPIC